MTRRNELDAMRGILLLIMALTHLPTTLSHYADQPLGFVSAAEGFVFLSAFLVGSIYSPQLIERGVEHVRARLRKRARRLYGFHVALLLFAFTVVAGIAYFSHSQSLQNFLFYFFHAPGWAAVSAPLLLYQPPLMDILPMYIVFLLLTPLQLQWASRRGWWLPLTLSLLLWTAAQLHVGRPVYGALAAHGYPLPKEAWSSFDWFAWQLIWVAGLWLGSGWRWSARPAKENLAALALPAGGSQRPLSAAPRATSPGAAALPVWWRRRGTYALAAAIAVAALLLCERHQLLSLLGGLDVNAPLANKWHLGPLRVANFALLGFISHRLLLPALKWLRMTVLELLGRSSLEVFTAHIPICMLADGLIGASAPALSAPQQLMLLILMLGVMLLVAWRTDAQRHAARATRGRLVPAGAVRVRDAESARVPVTARD